MTTTPRENLDAATSGVYELLGASDVELQPHAERIKEINTMVWGIIDEIEEVERREMDDEALNVMEEEITAQDNTTKSEETT